MTINKKIKKLFLFLTLLIGSQSIQASLFESVTKPLWENKVATLMTITTAIAIYSCYHIRKKYMEIRKNNINLRTENKAFKAQLKKEHQKAAQLYHLVKTISDIMQQKVELDQISQDTQCQILFNEHRELSNIEKFISSSLSDSSDSANDTIPVISQLDEMLKNIEDLCAEALGE